MTDEKETKEPQKAPEKKKMSLFRKIALTVIIILLLFSLIFEFFGGKAIKIAVEKAGSATLKVPVTVEEISLSPLAGKLGIEDMVIANPDGYQNPTLLELGSVKVDLATTSILSDIINVQEIKLDGMVLTIEQKGLTNNLKQIMDSLPKAEEKPADKEAEKKEEGEKKPGKKLHIDTLQITNVKVRAKLIPIPGKDDTIEFPLPTITMNDIGGKDKEPIDLPELIRKIFDAITEAVAKAGTEFLPDDIIGPLGDIVGNAPEQLKQLGEGTMDVGKDVLEKGGDIGKDITEGLKGIFQKK